MRSGARHWNVAGDGAWRPQPSDVRVSELAGGNVSVPIPVQPLFAASLTAFRGVDGVASRCRGMCVVSERANPTPSVEVERHWC